MTQTPGEAPFLGLDFEPHEGEEPDFSWLIFEVYGGSGAGLPSSRPTPDARIIGTIVYERKMLTPREVEVVELVDRGLTCEQIAEQLGISYYTAYTHARNARRVLRAQQEYDASIADEANV